MAKDTLCHPSDEPGYIVAWKYKYKFKAGKYADEVMTYGEAQKRAEELSAENAEMTFWPERKELIHEFHNPDAH